MRVRLALCLAGALLSLAPAAAQVAGVPDRIVFIGSDRSPLIDAVSGLEVSRVKALLDAGADPNRRYEADAMSWPPLALALRGGASALSLFLQSEGDWRARREIVELLLAHKADPNIRWCGDDDLACDGRPA